LKALWIYLFAVRYDGTGEIEKLRGVSTPTEQPPRKLSGSKDRVVRTIWRETFQIGVHRRGYSSAPGRFD
jgi:hypothetical protein